VPKHPTEIKSLARAHATRAIQRLAGIMDGSKDDGAVVRASIALLDRAYGKPNQPHDAKLDGELRITIRKMLDGT